MTTTNLRNHLTNTHKEIFKKLTQEPDTEKKETLVKIDEIFANTSKSEGCKITTTAIESKKRSSFPSSSNLFSENKQAKIQELFEKKKMMDDNNPKARKITTLIAEMISLDLQPYSIVDDKGFRRLIKHLAPNYKIPSRKTMTEKEIPMIYEILKCKVQQEINDTNFICLTTDGWTSHYGSNSFYSLTARIISSNFQVRCIILQLTNFTETHTGMNIAKFIEDSLVKWNIPKEKIQAIIADNAANMKVAIREADMLDEYLPCTVHTLQLCIQEKLFKQQRSIKDMLAIFRNIATHLNHSTSSTNKFREIQKQLNVKSHAIIQDVSTRWNSTYDMLERFIEQKKVVILFCVGKNMKCLTDNQWVLTETLVTVLSHFKDATLEMSMDDASISQIIPFIESMTKYLEYAVENASGIKTLMEELLKDFKQRFQQYREKTSLQIAMLLDPRFKLQFVTDQIEKEAITLSLAKEYKQLINREQVHVEGSSKSESSPEVDSNSASESESDSIGSPSKKLKKTGDIYSFFKTITSKDGNAPLKKGKEVVGLVTNQKTTMQRCMNEIKEYLSLPLAPKHENPYIWWKNYKFTRTERFSVGLSDLARKFLCISPTSVMSERLFSTSGNIFDKTRSRLTPEHGEQLAFIHCNFKNYNAFGE